MIRPSNWLELLGWVIASFGFYNFNIEFFGQSMIFLFKYEADLS